MIGKFLANALMLFIACVLCLTVHAQIANGTIRGTVTDSTGAVLPNATVVLVNQGTAEHYTQPSNQEGYYTFTSLSPADYVVKVAVPGFDAWEVKLTLRVAQEAVIDARLKPGAVKEVVTVTDATPIIDAADGTISDVKNVTQIETIPVQNSNFLNILDFTPGVVAGSYGGSGGGYTRVNGIPGGSVSFNVDGQSANDRFTNDLQITPQAIQTISELKVTTSNGGAEYATPGVVDVVTKGGTNQLHGQLHELYQTGGFEAQGFNALRNHLVHNDFGGDVGGPVWLPKLYNGKNKSFFFFDVQKQIDHRLKVDHEAIPEADWLTGNLSDLVDSNNGDPVTLYDPLSGVYNPANGGVVTRTAFANNDLSSRINASSAKVMSFMPKPNANVSSSGIIQNPVDVFNGGYDWINPDAFQTDNILRYTGKFDQLFGKNLLSARYTYTNESIVKPDLGGNQGIILNPNEATQGGHNGVLSFTTPIGSHAVNEARVGIQMFNAKTGPVPQPNIPTSIGLPVEQGEVAWPGIYWGALCWFSCSSGTTVGTVPSYIDRDNPKLAPNQDVTLGDNYSWTHGKHEMKFGFQATNYRVNTQEDQSPGGDYFFDGTFTGLQDPTTSLNPTGKQTTANIANETGFGFADMLLGLVDGTQFNLVPTFHTRQTDLDGYAQDSFKMSPRLTLDLGVRYEYWTPYQDAGGLTANLDLKHTAPACNIPTTLTGGAQFSCASTGATGYPAWFGQSSPMVVIPATGAAQKQPLNAAALAGFEAAGLPVETSTQAGLPNSLWNMSKNDWAPRLGFAYQLNAKTVIRGGYGMYYWTMPLVQYHQNTRDNAPWSTISNNYTDSFGNLYGAELAFPNGPGGFANQCAPSGACRQWGAGNNLILQSLSSISNTNGWTVATWDPNFKAQRAQEWNLTFERALPGAWAAKVSYLGNHGGSLPDYDPINASLPRALNPNANVVGDSTVSGLPYPIYGIGGEGSMDQLRFIGYSNHNEARGELNHTFKGSFMMQSYFTYARSLGTSEGTEKSFGGLELQPATLTNNASTTQRLRAIYAPDSYLPEKTFVINGHYELPFGKGKQFLAKSNTAVNEVVSGWNSSLFYMWHSGFYFSPRYSVNPGIGNGSNQFILAPGSANRGILPEGSRTRKEWFDGSIWDPASGNPYAGQTFEVRDNPLDWDLLNGIPRNYMTGPGFSNGDGTLYKLTPIGDHAMLDLELQVFNVFNHTNLGVPGNVGQITNGVNSAGATPRLLQFQGKITF